MAPDFTTVSKDHHIDLQPIQDLPLFNHNCDVYPLRISSYSLQSNLGQVAMLKLQQQYLCQSTIYKNKNETQPESQPSIENTIVKNLSNFFGVSKSEDESGHCIRCGENIPLKLDAPYCPDCYRTWAKYKDEDYKEKYCLKCGKPDETSMKRPLCLSCYKKTK